jgi:hypothetical protein
MGHKLFMMTTLVISLACSGKDIVPPEAEPVPSANAFVVYDDLREDDKLVIVDEGVSIPTEGQEISFQLWKDGVAGLDMGSREMLIRDLGDFVFWHRFMTTEYLDDPSLVLDNHDVVLIMNYRTRWKYEFVMERMYMVDGVLNIYYSYRADHDAEYGIVDYKFYLVDKAAGSYNFIEVE